MRKAGDREFEPDKIICAELFRRTHKALTITGYRLDTVRELTNIDRVFDWAVVWAERRKAEAAAAQEAVRAANGGGNGFDSSGCGYSIDQIEQFVREGAPRRSPLHLHAAAAEPMAQRPDHQCDRASARRVQATDQDADGAAIS